ncbi:MAG: V-type ATP synthase subunit A [Rhabdochlamydiaceae bacterium]|nr:V-type ATP synthase subunit A [Candidatus Amphrikana amoebophyrae]
MTEEKVGIFAKGHVTQVFGNLIHVQFEGDIRQGEVAFVKVDDMLLKAEVIEVYGNHAKVQVFEDTRGIEYKTPVEFHFHLLEAELGPGLLSSIFDGLQNPLEKVGEISGLFLNRGVYVPPLDRKRKWGFHPVAKVGSVLKRGDEIGYTMEGRFHHQIMLPFTLYGEYTLTWVADGGSFTIEDVIAKVKDSTGAEIELTMLQKWPIKAPLFQGKKIRADEMMDTGNRIIDTQFPILKGGTFCTPGPFGAGKTVLQHHLSKYSAVDIVLVCACGERAGEVVEVLKTFPHLIDPHTNEPLINRTILICNTSSMPVSSREASIYMGVTIAEYYRQMGLNLLLLADSTSRWAQAMREMSGRLEEIPGEEAFPAYLSSRIAAFYERSGVVSLANGKKGSLTIGGAVSPAGGNFEEPVTQATLAVVGAFLGLSRERSNARKYPSIDPMISWSKYTETVGKELSSKSKDWARVVQEADQILRSGDEIRKRMEVVGEEGISIDDQLVYLKAELYDFAYLQQNAFDKEDTYCPLKRQIELIEIIRLIFDSDFAFSSHDEARSYFLNLQNDIKNMNFTGFHSERYLAAAENIRKVIASASKQKEDALL